MPRPASSTPSQIDVRGLSSSSTPRTTPRCRALARVPRARAATAPAGQHLRPRTGERDPLRHRPATTPVVVVTMADGCDDPRQIDDLARLVERGVVVAAASRYMRRRSAGRRPAGQGPPVAARRASAWACSRGSARATRRTASRPTRPTSSARSASTAAAGFEIGLELTAKARRLRLPVAEIPTIWLDRTVGESNFELRAWIPRYLRWYRFAFGPRSHCRPGPRCGRSSSTRRTSRTERKGNS